MKQLYIKASYLNIDLDEKIYINIPPEGVYYNKCKIWLLNKVLYGLKEFGRAWNKKISSLLESTNMK